MAPNKPNVSCSWRPLGAVEPSRLVETRLALHYAAQAIASFGQALIEARDDDSHRSMDWTPGEGTLESDLSANGLRARLVVPRFVLAVDRNGKELCSLGLRGERPGEVLRWLGDALGEAAEEGVSLTWPEYDLPKRPGGDDVPMEPDEAALVELCAWFDDAAAVLVQAFGDRPEASSVRCWPHHFDIGTLLNFPAAEAGSEARYVGVGLSPGDEREPSPYYYVNGWPAPDPAALPPLSGPGRWNTEGWVGVVLDAEGIVGLGSAEEQEKTVRTFLSSASEAMQRLVLG